MFAKCPQRILSASFIANLIRRALGTYISCVCTLSRPCLPPSASVNILSYDLNTINHIRMHEKQDVATGTCTALLVRHRDAPSPHWHCSLIQTHLTGDVSADNSSERVEPLLTLLCFCFSDVHLVRAPSAIHSLDTLSVAGMERSGKGHRADWPNAGPRQLHLMIPFQILCIFLMCSAASVFGLILGQVCVGGSRQERAEAVAC